MARGLGPMAGIDRGPGAVAAVLSALFPHFCAGCGQEGNVLCLACEIMITAPMRAVFCCPGCGGDAPGLARCGKVACARSSVDGIVAAAPYGTPVLRTLLYLYKYEGVDEAGERLSMIFRRCLIGNRSVLSPFFGQAAVVPVPLHYFRQALRGFNQSDRFAMVIAEEFSGRVCNAALGRRYRFTAQAKIASVERRRSAAARSVFPRSKISGNVVLVDDVATTMATISECARALKSAGAGKVYAAVVLKG